MYLDVGLETLEERTKTREKVSVKLHFEGDGSKKVQKPGRDERTEEDYPTSAVFLHM